MLSKLLEYLLEEELEEQNVLSAGGVAATSTGIALDTKKFHAPPKNDLNEVNTVYGTYGLSGADESNVSVNDSEFAEDSSDTKTPGNSKKHDENHKRHKLKKSKKDYSPLADTMWNYGDKPTGDIPATRIKYIALEESVNLKKKQNIKIIVDKQLKQKSFETIVDFIKFTNSILKLNTLPAIYLHMIKKPEMTTGMFNRESNTLHVLVGKRLIVDVLRTIAHELTHAKQHEAGLLDIHLAVIDPTNEMADIDTPYENEAYTLAGNIVKIFCRKYPKITKDELYQLNENKL